MNDATALCEGCLRSLDEIARWAAMADDEKRVVWRAIERRRAEASQAAGAARHLDADAANDRSVSPRELP